MNVVQVRKRLKYLQKEIKRHNDLYYLTASPEISDFEYDMLVKELEYLEKTYPQLVDANPLTDKVSSDLITNNVKAHKKRMYSLDNAYSLEELHSFLFKTAFELGLPFTEVLLEHKIDGFSLNLYYENGTLPVCNNKRRWH